jgi:predicted ribosomally synthesized peptide with nif11-like leader
MSDPNLARFLGTVDSDLSLQAQLKNAADVDAVVSIAKAAGFSISAEEIRQAQVPLSDEELEEVAGGSRPYTHIYASNNHCAHHQDVETVVGTDGHHYLKKYYHGQ